MIGAVTGPTSEHAASRTRWIVVAPGHTVEQCNTPSSSYHVGCGLICSAIFRIGLMAARTQGVKGRLRRPDAIRWDLIR